MNKRLTFAKEFVTNPEETGALFVSSKELTECIVNNAGLSEASCVVELGPGTGVFSVAIKENIRPGSTYFAIESNENFVSKMKLSHTDIPVHHDTAENIKTILRDDYHRDECDRIISGLPWTAFSPEKQEQILAQVHEALAPGGMFLTFAYHPLNHLPQGKSFNKLLQKYFSSVKKTKVVRNFPPAFVYVCTK